MSISFRNKVVRVACVNIKLTVLFCRFTNSYNSNRAIQRVCYTLIKARIIAGFSTSSESRLRQLLKGEVMSHGKPSVILKRLRSLNDCNCSDEIIKSIFLDQMPANIKAIIASCRLDSLDDLAQMADKVAEAISPGNLSMLSVEAGAPSNQTSVSAVSFGTSLGSLEAQVSNLTEQVKKLTIQLGKAQGTQPRGHGRDRWRGRSKSRNRGSRDHSQSRSASNLCYYHDIFDKRARRCVKPCSWQEPEVSENLLSLAT